MRPFWTEKSAFLEGDAFYAVGVATGVDSIEEGRKLAFLNGKQEIMNFVQLTNLLGLEIYTQMTYEEQREDELYNVFRLLKVNYEKLRHLKTNQLQQAYTNMQALQRQQAREIDMQEQQIALKKHNIDRIKENWKRLDELDQRYQLVITNIDVEEKRACKYLVLGMTKDEVSLLAGKPRSRNSHNNIWRYGAISVNFKDGVVDNFGGYQFLYCRLIDK